MIWCLHGFLGRGADWEPLRAACEAAGLPKLRAPDLFAPGASLGPKGDSLAAWGARFTAHAAPDRPPVLVGYSLGGRLALHALLARPAAWHAAVIVSAHLGLPGEAERQTRREADDAWARRFEGDPWDALLADWNAQDVFDGSGAALERPETAYDRVALATALRAWSLGAQPPLGDRLATITCPVLWIAGERDPRYIEQGEAAVRALPHGELRVAPEAGHRVPWKPGGWFERAAVEFMR